MALGPVRPAPGHVADRISMIMHPVFRFFDPIFIWCYRITGYAPADFVIGTFVLALLAVALGELTVSLVFRVARRPITQAAAEARKYQDLSMDALAAGDRPSYEAANQLANDAFSKSFFTQIGLSGAFLWPVFVALAWMSYRFGELAFPLPLIHLSLGYIGVFILLYIPAYFLFKRVKRRLPFGGRIDPPPEVDHHREGIRPDAAPQTKSALTSGPAATPARD
jgi:hypothetical protein